VRRGGDDVDDERVSDNADDRDEAEERRRYVREQQVDVD